MSTSPKNIVYIMLDDADYYDFGFLNATLPNPDVVTPNIDALRNGGAAFNNFYSAAPICTPTRVSVLTGDNPVAHGATHVWQHNEDGRPGASTTNGLSTAAPLLGAAMQELGLKTGHFGKWHVGASRPEYLHEALGFDEYSYHLAAATDTDLTDWSGPTNFHTEEGSYVEDVDFVDSEFADEVVDFIDRASAEDQGFFLNFWPLTPHAPIAIPRNFDNSVTQFDLSTDRGKMLAMIQTVDREIGRIVQSLRDNGILDDTLVIVTSDNGGLPPVRHDSVDTLGGKHQLWEGGIQVPMVAHWPNGIDPGIENESVMGTHDLLPTFVELLGGDASAFYASISGRSKLDAFSENEDLDHEPILWQVMGTSEATEDPRSDSLYALRYDDYKITKRKGRNDDTDSNAYDLMDMTGENAEYRNLANGGKETGIFEAMKALLLEARLEQSLMHGFPSSPEGRVVIPFDPRYDVGSKEMTLSFRIDVPAEISSREMLYRQLGSQEVYLRTDGSLGWDVTGSDAGGNPVSRLLSSGVLSEGSHVVTLAIRGYKTGNALLSISVDGVEKATLAPDDPLAIRTIWSTASDIEFGSPTIPVTDGRFHTLHFWNDEAAHIYDEKLPQHVFGYSRNDVIVGGADREVLMGGQGDDAIYIGHPEDYVDGGHGNDWLVFDADMFEVGEVSRSGDEITIGSNTFVNIEYLQFDNGSVEVARMFDAPELSFGSAEISVQEASGLQVVLELNLSRLAVSDVTIDFSTRNGTAIAGEDYAARTGSVTILAGMQTAQVVLDLLNDELIETEDAFFVDFTTRGDAGFEGGGTAASARIEIGDDDAAISLSVDPGDLAISETDTGVTRTVLLTRTGNVSGEDIVRFTITGSGAMPADASDFASAMTGKVTFAAGVERKRIAFTIEGDNLVESHETFTWSFSKVSGNAQILDSSADFTILNDDREYVGGTLQGDLLTGSDLPEEFVAAAGADRVLPGRGTDLISLGTGEDAIVATSLADLDGDIVTDFTQQDEIVFAGQRLDRSSFSVRPGSAIISVDVDGDGGGDGTFILRGDFSRGDFMVVREGEDTILTFEDYLPDLQNRRAVSNAEVNGIANQQFLTGDGSSDFSVTLRGLGSAGYSNVVGVYEIDGSGAFVDARILFKNAKAGGGRTTTITDVEDGHQLGFFLVQDAAEWAAKISGGDTLSFVTRSGHAATLDDAGALELAVNGSIVDQIIFHSFSDRFNDDGVQHALSGVDAGGHALTIGFEDKLGGGDRDYNDVVFSVEIA